MQGRTTTGINTDEVKYQPIKMRQSYNTDLSSKEWEIIAPMMPKPSKLGRPPKIDFREVLNGIFYIAKNGCTWQNLPHDFPPYSTVYFYFQRWTRTGVIAKINRQISEQVRLADGREATPSLLSLDSQSVKTMDSAGSRGIDGGKNVNGRKRFIMAILHTFYWCLQVVVPPVRQKGFVVQQNLWVVERTFAWFSRFRRLNRESELLPETSEAFFYVGMIQILLKLLA